MKYLLYRSVVKDSRDVVITTSRNIPDLTKKAKDLTSRRMQKLSDFKTVKDEVGIWFKAEVHIDKHLIGYYLIADRML